MTSCFFFFKAVFLMNSFLFVKEKTCFVHPQIFMDFGTFISKCIGELHASSDFFKTDFGTYLFNYLYHIKFFEPN